MFTLMKDMFVGFLFITVYVILMIPYKVVNLFMYFKLKQKNKRERF
jgi:hypothetical protein